MYRSFVLLIAFAGFLFPDFLAHAQFNLDGQIVQRSEYRNGFGRLLNESEEPAFFIAHRARLQASYKLDNLTLYVSAQDVRVWGNTSQIKLTDNFLSVHEAWAEVAFSDTWAAKLGRQELNYDNFRFLGNLDWALQGRAHDLALIKHEKGSMKLHFGAAYNQNEAKLTGTLFTVPNQYKAAQIVRYENTFGGFQFSALFWNDGRQFVQTDTSGALLDKKTYYRQTLGLPTLKFTKGTSQINGYVYVQTGKDQLGRSVSAYNYSIYGSQRLLENTENGRALTLAAGYEAMSGNSPHENSKNRAFSPQYGTNHLFNGYMDQFYVGGMHENNVGLHDVFFKTRYAFNSKLFVQADIHGFFAQADIFENNSSVKLDPYLGSELDLSLGYVYTSSISLQAGYSQFFHSDTFSYVQGATDPADTQNWAYLMLIFRPTMRNKFIGIFL